MLKRYKGKVTAYFEDKWLSFSDEKAMSEEYRKVRQDLITRGFTLDDRKATAKNIDPPRWVELYVRKRYADDSLVGEAQIHITLKATPRITNGIIHLTYRMSHAKKEWDDNVKPLLTEVGAEGRRVSRYLNRKKGFRIQKRHKDEIIRKSAALGNAQPVSIRLTSKAGKTGIPFTWFGDEKAAVVSVTAKVEMKVHELTGGPDEW